MFQCCSIINIINTGTGKNLDENLEIWWWLVVDGRVEKKGGNRETVEKFAKLEYNTTMSSKEKMKVRMNADREKDIPKHKQNTSPQTGKNKPDYDSAWKEVIERLFEPFTEFFFPDIHKDIDFSRGIEILDSELRDIAPYGNVGKRYADELVKVHLKDGSQACIWVFIHIEVQGTKEKKGIFPERAYIYNYRIYDKNIEKGVKVISVAILTDEDEKYRPDEYLVQQWGFELRMKIPMVKIIGFKNKKELRELLEISDNPMAMIVKAQLKNYELKKAGNEQKSSVKWELIRQCYERKYPKEEIRVLLKFIDWLIRLPVGLTKQLSKKIAILEEEYKMPYVTSWERLGKEEGKKEGKLEVAKELLINGVSVDIVVKSTGFPREEIEKLAKAVSS
jgi:predicted transposase/invertase (TIGR01784 family)